MPGFDWVQLFLKRHPRISFRFATNIKNQKAELNSTVINEYFDNLQEELANIPPENIYNFDETNLTDDPGRLKVLTKKGSKYPEKVMHSSKASTSIMFCGNAGGEFTPPYVVYKATHIYDTWREGGPAKCRYNRTKSGWFDATTCEDWFESLLLPILKRKEGAKVVIGDNLSSHLSVHILELCKEHNIKFICLPPNSTHLMQPLDVAFFAPLKRKWRFILRQYKETHNGPINKTDFPKELKKLVNEISPTAPESLPNGFKKCGIYPLDRNAVLDRIPKDHQTADQASPVVGVAVLDYLKVARFGSPFQSPKQTRKKTKINVVPGKSVVNVEGNDTEDDGSELEIEENENILDDEIEANIACNNANATIENQTDKTETEANKTNQRTCKSNVNSKEKTMRPKLKNARRCRKMSDVLWYGRQLLQQ